MAAYTLFVDLSGFTSLTETLMREGAPGAEHLSIMLNQIFAPLVQLVYARGGFIPYFAGDAFTAIFPAVSQPGGAKEAVNTAIAARQLISDRSELFGEFIIGIKVGVSFGDVEWGIVGQNSKAFYFRGEAIDRCSECQLKARQDEIVIDEALHEQLDGKFFLLEEIDHGFFKLIGHPGQAVIPVTPAELPPLREEVAAAFLPPPLQEQNFDGEFRIVIAVFISFTGVETHDSLDSFASVVLEQINDFSGYFKEIDFGDKGGVLVCFFGAPVSFENNVDRALEFILSLKEELHARQDNSALEVRAGITIGTAFTGIVGGEERCQYAVVGNRVNLAARLMTFADWGEVLVDAEIQRNRHFRFQHKGDIKYKGIKGNVPTFKLMGREFDMRPAHLGQMVGRNIELGQLLQFASPLDEGKCAGIAYVYGEAGIGKSRLSFEMRRILHEEGEHAWCLCQADQILRKPFNPFIYFLKNYFSQSADDTPSANWANFDQAYDDLLTGVALLDGAEAERVHRELLRTRSVLAAMVGLLSPGSLWDLLDAKGRYQNAIQAVINLFDALSLQRPLIIELEDAHWLDDSSEELLTEFARQMSRYPVLLLVTSRYRDDGSKVAIVNQDLIDILGIPQLEVNLNVLQPEAVNTFASTRLQGPISASFFDMLLRTTNSNPFYVEQVLEYFLESNLVIKEDGKWTMKDKNIGLSNSINAILTARIDRLSTLVKETVKAAAVIGREFEVPVLTEVMKVQEEFVKRDNNAQSLLREQIKTAERGQIWLAMNELRYIFRHSLLREAAYSMQLRARLQQLHHLIAEAIERLYADTIEERYVDLAFHYEQAGVFDKTCEYLRKAADYARSNYQNQQALEYYERLLKKLGRQKDAVDEIKTNLKKGKILELIGRWDECRQTYERALQLAKKSRDVVMLGQANNSLGHLLMLKGDYGKAMGYLQTAAGLFESVDDKTGTAKVYGNLGNLYFRQGNYAQAKEHFEQSIAIGMRSGSAAAAQIVANLGLTYMNQGNFDEGIRCQQAQLAICERNNDKQGMATLFTNIGIVYFEKGDYDAALGSYEKGLMLSEELGNKQLTAIAIGCIGSVYQRKGDYPTAMEHFRHDLEICEELGDKQGIAIALGLIGELLNVQGESHKAIDYLQKNLMLCEELGYQKGIAKAVNTLGDVFANLQQYERSLYYYDRAIEVTRKINNKLVLGASLVEKGAVLIAMQQYEQLQNVCKEAQSLAEELGNPDLLFDARLLSLKNLYFSGQTQKAVTQLQSQLQSPLSKEQEAAVYYELFKMSGENAAYRAAALALYEDLYRDTPRNSYKNRIDQLSAPLQ